MSNTEFEPAAIQEGLGISIIVIYIVISVVSITANILIVLVLWRKFRRRRKTTRDTSFIVVTINQVLSHLVFVLVTIPLTLVKQSSLKWPFSDLWCRIVEPLPVSVLLPMMFSYVVLARYLWKRMRGLFGQMKSIISTMCVVWILSFILITAHVVKVSHEYGSRTCGQNHLSWNVVLVTLLYLTSIPSILRVRCLAVKYLQRGSLLKERIKSRSTEGRSKSSNFRDLGSQPASHYQRPKCILRMLSFSIVVFPMSAPYTASLIVQDVYGTNLTSPLWQVFAFLNVFMYSVAFLNPVMFFVSNPDFKRDLWHLIKCHYIKKERKVFSFENPSVSFPEESDSRPGSQLKPLPLDDFSEPVYASKPSTPTLNRVEVYAVPLENNSEVPCVKASMVPTQVGQLSKVEKERKSSPLASPFPFPNPIFENTDAQSAGSFDQETTTVNPRNEVVTEKQVADISDEVGTCWRQLGPRLKIAESKIHNIDEENSGNWHKAHALLIMWKQTEGKNATVGHLADVLEKIGRRSIAEKLLEPRNTSEVGAGGGDFCELNDGSSKHEFHGKRLLMFQKSNEDIHSAVQQSTKK